MPHPFPLTSSEKGKGLTRKGRERDYLGPILLQIKGIIGEFGLVVISRSGHNAEKFVYESDKLFHLKVMDRLSYITMLGFSMQTSLLFCLEQNLHLHRMDSK